MFAGDFCRSYGSPLAICWGGHCHNFAEICISQQSARRWLPWRPTERYLTYLDANSLCATAQSEPLPVGSFKFWRKRKYKPSTWLYQSRCWDRLYHRMRPNLFSSSARWVHRVHTYTKYTQLCVQRLSACGGTPHCDATNAQSICREFARSDPSVETE